jgi:hypothetical protein
VVATNPWQIQLRTPIELIGPGISDGHPALQSCHKSEPWVDMLDRLLGLHGPADLMLQIRNEPVIERNCIFCIIIKGYTMYSGGKVELLVQFS